MLPKPTAARSASNPALYSVQLKQHDARFLKEFEANIGDFKEVQSCPHRRGV